MALHYYWGVDLSLIEVGFRVGVTDSSGAAGADRSFNVVITSGTFAHVDFSSVLTGWEDFAGVLETAVNAGSAGGATPQTHTISFATSTGYTWSATGTKLTLDFTGTEAQIALRRFVGMTGDRSGSMSYGSQVRPHYWIIPTIQGRSNDSDDYEPDGISSEASGDDGSVSQISKDTAETFRDWTQAAEPIEPDAGFTFDDPWTAPYERQATSAAPWSYQHAFRHARTGGTEQSGTMPFLVVDGSESSVHALRADGTAFHPQRFAGVDFPLWSIAFKTRVLGRL